MGDHFSNYGPSLGQNEAKGNVVDALGTWSGSPGYFLPLECHSPASAGTATQGSLENRPLSI